MSDVTNTATPTQAPLPTEAPASVLTKTVPWFTQCMGDQQLAILDECEQSGIPVREFAAALAEFASYAEYQGQTTAVVAPSVATTPERIAEQSAATKAAQQVAEESERKQIAAQLSLIGTICRRGDRDQLRNLWELAETTAEYIRRRVTLKDKHDVAVDDVRAELQKQRRVKVDASYVTRLLQSWQASKLLSAGMPEVPELAYSHYRDVWCLLAERHDKGLVTEHYVLLPGFEQASRELFTTATANCLSLDACKEQVQTIVRDYSVAQREAAKLAAARLTAEADQKAAAEAKAAQELRVKEQELAAVAKAASDAKDTEQAAILNAAFDAAKAELLQRQKEQTKRQAEQAELEQAKRKAGEKATATAKAAAKAEDKLNPDSKPAAKCKGTPSATGTVAESGVRAPATALTFQLMAKQGKAEEIAKAVLTLLSCEKPQDVLRIVFGKLDLTPEIGRAVADGMFDSRGDDAAECIAAVLDGLAENESGMTTEEAKSAVA